MDRTIKSQDAVAGRILWLPPFNEVLRKSIKRVGGKGPIESRMFNHPVVICSRPANYLGDMVHFHIITSFGGKSLAEMYGGSSDFHYNKRLGYLPISPAPNHPDGLRSLFLGGSSTLRRESYVNVAEIYEIDLNFLWTYTNPEAPRAKDFHLGKGSVKYLRKVEATLGYCIEPQFPAASQPGRVFGMKMPKPGRISTGELEDLELDWRSMSQFVEQPRVVDIPEGPEPLAGTVVASHKKQDSVLSGMQNYQNPKPVASLHDESNNRPGDLVLQMERRNMEYPDYWRSQTSDSIPDLVSETEEAVPRDVVGTSLARAGHLNGWLDAYLSVVTRGFKKVTCFARWITGCAIARCSERDASPV